MSTQVNELKPYIGIPFENGGRTIQGADCWGLVMLVFEHFGVQLPDYQINCFATDDINGQIDQARNEWRPIRRPEAPCLVVMRIDPDVPQACNHLGVYVGNGFMIHTLIRQDSHLERMDHPYFKRKIEGFYRYAGAR